MVDSFAFNDIIKAFVKKAVEVLPQNEQEKVIDNLRWLLMKRLPKKLSKKNKDKKKKKRTSCLYTSRCLPTRGGKNDDKCCIKRSKYA